MYFRCRTDRAPPPVVALLRLTASSSSAAVVGISIMMLLRGGAVTLRGLMMMTRPERGSSDTDTQMLVYPGARGPRTAALGCRGVRPRPSR